jgi:hypothetical protein
MGVEIYILQTCKGKSVIFLCCQIESLKYVQGLEYKMQEGGQDTRLTGGQVKKGFYV